MPLRDCTESKDQTMTFFRHNLTSVLQGGDDNIYHSFCTAIGGRGCGKTRICKEIVPWCQEFVNEIPEVRAKKKKALQIFVTNFV